MIFTPLKYHTYKFLASGILKRKRGYYRSLLSQETLLALKQRIKDAPSQTNSVVAHLSPQQLTTCGNIHQVFTANGKPSYFKSHQSGGIVHDVVLYKQQINGLQSRVVYHFVNRRIASVRYAIQVLTQKDEQKVNLFLEEASLPEIQKALKIRRGNMAKAKDPNRPNEISFTFINHNPEVIQNINAAVYIDRYSNSTVKYVDDSGFQLTF